MISLILAAALIAAPHDACEWAKPGSDPYRAQGDVTRALSDLSLSPEDRKVIGAKMDALKYDDMVAVTTQGVDSSTHNEHYSSFRDMHSGHSTCHGPVTTKSWAPDHRELALVYCGSGSQCVLVPLVCANIGLVDRVPVKPDDPVAAGPIDIQPAAGPQLAPVEDKSIYPAIADGGDWVWGSGGGYWGGGFYDGGGGGGGGFPGRPPGPPASGPSCGCTPPPHNPPPICVVPEPYSSAMLIAGILGLLGFRFIRRRR